MVRRESSQLRADDASPAVSCIRRTRSTSSQEPCQCCGFCNFCNALKYTHVRYQCLTKLWKKTNAPTPHRQRQIRVLRCFTPSDYILGQTHRNTFVSSRCKRQCVTRTTYVELLVVAIILFSLTRSEFRVQMILHIFPNSTCFKF